MSLRSFNLSLAFLLALACACGEGDGDAGSHTRVAVPAKGEVYMARAYALQGITADGSRVERGIVAADIKLLPLGTRISVTGAGSYSGEYVVRDTGRLVQGRRLDLYVPTTAEARRFGRKLVKVHVLSARKSPPAAPRAAVVQPPHNKPATH